MDGSKSILRAHK